MQHKLFLHQFIIRKKELESTNDFALEFIKSQNPENGTVVLAQNQTAGKGQQNNSWESESGKNLTFSIILRPDFLSASQQFLISILISLGVYDYLCKHVNCVSIKWPNDIYVEDQKIAGILIEHISKGMSLDASICGIGLNINQKQFASHAPNPVSLWHCTKQVYDLDSELNKLLACIECRYFQLKNGKIMQMQNDYLKALYRIGTWYRYKDCKGIFFGKIVGVNEFGQIQILVNSKIRTYNFKEVAFVLH